MAIMEIISVNYAIIIVMTGIQYMQPLIQKQILTVSI